MKKINIRKAWEADIPAIRTMADIVFRKTYADILSPGQMEYMMEWMYSTESLKEQVGGQGKEFFIAEDASGAPCGYVSVEREGTLEDARPLFHLQKLYVLPSCQGCGLGRQLFEFVVAFLREGNPHGCRMELNVNRDNRAVNFYERMGMRRDRQGDFHIGGGYYMNDYIYSMDI